MFNLTPRNTLNNNWTILSPIISILCTIIIAALIFKILNYPVLEPLSSFSITFFKS